MPRQIDENHIHELACPGLHKTGIAAPDKKWSCRHPDCFAYFKREQIIGKRSICAVCHQNEIILTTEALKNAFPRCLECSTKKADVQARKKAAATKNLMDEVLADTEEKEKENETAH